MTSDAQTSHRIVWHADQIDFVSWSGWGPLTATNVISQWTYTGPDIPTPGPERVHFNLWLVGGVPANGRSDEVIVRSFHYQP